ncbi:Zinc finger CCCH domain-containing protein 48 [Vitis vinifera]|uniref:Zinc finger CCCH domain-containing protein 48 n=1 Tax=Vitis vinifera TaxID=29760 RepID=A0A438EYS0_VITVI|nr:Zinc finger CCCH domain-containing protein 48 [Vitis vinifera]
MDVKPIRLARNKNERGRHVNNIVCSYVAPRITSKTPAIKFQITSTTQKCSLGSNQSHRNSRERSLDSNQKDESDSTNLKCSSSPTSAGVGRTQWHIKAIYGIALPSGSEKLYTASECHSGHYDGVVNLGREIGSSISADPWLLAGIKIVVKAWNIQSCADLSLDRPVGQIRAMVVDNDMLFAGA